jgi:hypothetical protein
LVLSPFERFMLTDDRPRNPMTFLLHFGFQGEMQRGPFQAALEEALARHPLLQSVVAPVKGNRLCWVHDAALRPPVDWSGATAPVEVAPAEPNYLRHHTGLKMWLRVGEGRTEWILEFHHACCDGIGAYRFCGDLLCRYGQLTCGGQEAPEAGPLDPMLLRSRIRKMRFSNDRETFPRTRRFALRYGWNLLRHAAASVAPPRHGNERWSPVLGTGILTQCLEPDEFRRLRETAVGCGASCNDLVLAELLRTIARWNESRRGRRGKRIRILMPVDLRSPGDECMPAANMASYTFLERWPDECRDPRQLLRGVVEESLRIRRDGAGAAFIEAIGWGFTLRGAMPLAVAGSRCLASAIYTNPGDPTKRFTARFPRRAGTVVCGDLVLDQFCGSPPLRPKTHVALVTSAFRRKLTVCVRCDPRLFDAASAQQFLDCCMEGLRSWLAPPHHPR